MKCSGKSLYQGNLEALHEHLCMNKSLFYKLEFYVY